MNAVPQRRVFAALVLTVFLIRQSGEALGVRSRSIGSALARSGDIIQSARGLAHSKTLRAVRLPEVGTVAPGGQMER
ncbi:MAG: hypothetical protein C5B50_07295 [Verrucomicrobia bacterium]|nr:MAG: hypothetical protein C5B50_07295 [Verrucomicrobiota bacterium]